MTECTIDTLFQYIIVIDFGLILIILGIGLHIAYTKMDFMLSHLKNCPAVMLRVPFKDGGPGGRLFLLGAIMGLMTTPRVYLRDGGASEEDLKNFPKGLKRKLAVIHWTNLILILIMLLAVAVIKIIRS